MLDTPHIPHSSSCFQFSIRQLLIATAAIAAALAAASAEASWQSCLALEFLGILFASIAIIAAFKSHGAFRVFWIAAAVPASGGAAVYLVYGCIAGMSSIMMAPDETLVMILGGLRLALPVLWCLSLANGFVCGLVCWVAWPGKKVAGRVATTTRATQGDGAQVGGVRKAGIPEVVGDPDAG